MSRRFQFSLRALLLLVAVIGIYAWIAHAVYEDHSPNLTRSDLWYLERAAEAERERQVGQSIRKAEHR